MPDRPEMQVLVLAPTGRDATLVERVLREEGFSVLICDSFEEMMPRVQAGVGAVVAAEEGLPVEARETLVRWIEAQPPWSDLPLILLTMAHARRSEAIYTALGPRANLRLLERPVGTAVLLAAVRSAVRERRRQYEVHSLLMELEAADRRKGDFMALLGHEVRNPLASIKVAVQLLQRKASDPALERMSGLIDRQTDTISRLLDDLLELSRCARGKIDIELAPTDLRSLVAEHLRGLRARSEAQGRSIRLDLPDEPVVASVDPMRVEQMLSNLVTNALKYTPPPGRIYVGLLRDGDAAVLKVRDEGIGICAEMLPRIFEAFVQVEGARRLAQGGLGLGLSLVRNLVDLHCGSIEARSEGAGKGSEFVVRLPLHPPALESARA